MLEAFAKRFPDSVFADLAKARISELKTAMAPQPPRDAAPPESASGIRRSQAAGGAVGGNPFDDADYNAAAAAITRLDIGLNRSIVNGSELIVGGVQAYWGDTASAKHGFGGPAPMPTQSLRLDDGETIRNVAIFAHRFTWHSGEKPPLWVSGLQVRTSKRTVSYGDMVGTKTTCEIKGGERLVGFYGRAGSYVDQLGCLIAAAPR